MKITNEIDETMITVQHQRVYLAHFGLPVLQLSDQLMKAVSMQILHEDLGTPILIACLEHALHPMFPCKLPCNFCVKHNLMFSIHVHMTENVHGRIHPIFRLNQEIHQDKMSNIQNFMREQVNLITIKPSM
jgi:hypothetical protein